MYKPKTDNQNTEEFKIYFSNYEAIKETIREFFQYMQSKVDTFRMSDISLPKLSLKEINTLRKRDVKLKIKMPKFFGSDFAKPWPEHKIIFDIDIIKAKGYIRSEQKSVGRVNGYYFYKKNGSGQFFRYDMLLLLKMARKI